MNLKTFIFFVSTWTDKALKLVPQKAKAAGIKTPVILYDQKVHSVFDKKNSPFEKGEQQQLKQMMTNCVELFPERLEKITNNQLASLNVAYFWNTPSQTLPILHYQYPGIWQAPFPRYWGQTLTRRGEEKPDRGD